MDRQQLKQRFRDFMNNHIGVFWIVVGIASSMGAPWCLLHGMKAVSVMIGSGVGSAVLFGLACKLRDRPMMRNRKRKWWMIGTINCVVSVIASSTVVRHPKSQEWMKCSFLLAVAVHALIETAKPSFDFGILQFFIRIPIQTAFMYFKDFGGWHVGGIALVIVSTYWNAYSIYVYTEAFDAAQARGRDAARDQGPVIEGDPAAERDPTAEGGPTEVTVGIHGEHEEGTRDTPVPTPHTRDAGQSRPYDQLEENP